MVTQSWCSGLCLASFSSLTSDLCIFIILYPMGSFCFCSGLSLRGVTRRILQAVLSLTFTTGTWHCGCQWRFWNVYTGQMCVPSIQNGLKEHTMQGGERTAWKSIAFTEMELPLRITWHLPGCVKFGVNVSWTQWGVAGLCIRCLWSKQVAEPRTCC